MARLTPVALGRRHDALLRELHHRRRQLLAARHTRALPLRVTRDGGQLLPRQPDELGLTVAAIYHSREAHKRYLWPRGMAINEHQLTESSASVKAYAVVLMLCSCFSRRSAAAAAPR